MVGVEQDEDGQLDPVGLPSLTDKTDVLSGIEGYLPDELRGQIGIMDFAYEESEYPKLKDKAFQVLLIDDDPAHLPFLAARGGTNLRRAAVYTRRGAATTEADHDELQRIVNRRLETGYSSCPELDLKTHLEQLRVLFDRLSPYETTGSPWIGNAISLAVRNLMQAHAQTTKRNPNYPAENYEMFIQRSIARKKRRIEIELDIEEIPTPEGL